MKTDDLIRVLSADETMTRPPERILPWAVPATGVAMAVLFFWTMGFRDDWPGVLWQPVVLLKQILPVGLALAAFGLVVRLARPGAGAGPWRALVLIACGIAAGAFAVTAARLPVAAWGAAVFGETIVACLFFIVAMGAPVLALSLWVLRRGASTRPNLTGALAGVMSGAVAAGIYAGYCPEDNPMFWAVWYGSAIGVLGLAGLAMGRRILRW